MNHRSLDTAEALLDLVRAFAPARLLLTAAEHDLFSRIEAGAVTADSIAAAAGTDPRATGQVLNGLAACGLLIKEAGRYRNTDAARRFLVAASPENILPRLAFQRLLWERWSCLSEGLRLGHVDSLPPVMERPVPELCSFLEALHQFGSQQAPRVAAAAGLAGLGSLLDVGGGLGTFSMTFCRLHPQLRAVLFELPQVAPLAIEKIAEAGLSDRITVYAGDAFTDPLFRPGEAPYDAILLSNVVHLFPADRNRELLARLAGALAPQGRLLIHDVLMDEDRVRPVYGAMLSLTMLVMSDRGATYTEAELRAWLAEAGLPHVHRIQVEPDIALLIAGRSPEFLAADERR